MGIFCSEVLVEKLDEAMLFVAFFVLNLNFSRHRIFNHDKYCCGTCS